MTRSSQGPAIHVVIFKQPGANVIETVDAVKAALPQLRAAVPPGINMNIVADRTLTIRASVKEVKMTLLITIVLVVVVIFLFLRNVMATAIPSAVIPVSLFATAAVMLPAHFTLDNLSLMALTIAVGFVVDDAIVMVEAIWRRIEHGQRPFEAALAGSREIGFTILTISISLIAVFTPVMFIGRGDRHHHARVCPDSERGGVVSVILSLTLTPMLCGPLPESTQAADLTGHEGAGGRLPRPGDPVRERAGSSAATQGHHHGGVRLHRGADRYALRQRADRLFFPSRTPDFCKAPWCCRRAPPTPTPTGKRSRR